jgi:hypothetical protein
VERVSGHWNWKGWGIGEGVKKSLWENLGTGVVSFLLAQRQGGSGDAPGVVPLPRYVVSKTPSVENLEFAPRFPRSRTLVIVRDGRSVVSSGMKGFKWTFDHATRRWTGAANTILRARDAGQDFLLIRYEDLLTDLSGQMARIFRYLALDGSSYDLAAAENLPLTGSSFVPGTEFIHWGKIPRGDVGGLLNRYANWTTPMHVAFNRIAGEQMKQFGYDLVGADSPRTTVRGWLNRVRSGCARRLAERRPRA